MHNLRVNACSTKDAYIFPRPYRMGLCASSAKDTVGRESIQYASGWVDDEALHEALSLLQGYTHTTFDSEEDLQERFDLDNAKLISGGDKYDNPYLQASGIVEFFGRQRPLLHSSWSSQ